MDFRAGSRLKQIADECFQGCALAEFLAPPELQDVGARAFQECVCLRTLELNEGLKSIGVGAFGQCGLRDARVPGSVKVLGRLKAGRGGFSPEEYADGRKEIGVE